MLIDDSVATCYNPPQRKGADMTRTIRDELMSVDNALQQAAGVLALAGNEVSDARVQDLIEQAAHGEFSAQRLVEEVTKLLDE